MEIYSAPFIRRRQRDAICRNIRHLFDLDRLVEAAGWNWFEELRHWLSVPEIMLIEERDQSRYLLEFPIAFFLTILAAQLIQ